MNKICVNFLEEILKINENSNCIVITHHVPSRSLIDEKYLKPSMLPYNQWFYCDMDKLFTSNIKCWFYGHTHMPCNKIINGISFLCNPIGYPDENTIIDFNAKFIL